MSKKRIEAICVAAKSSPSTELRSLPTGPIQAIRPEDVPRSRPKVKAKPCDRPDARLKHLDSLHAKSQVQENLRLPAGRRIKLEDHWANDTEVGLTEQAAILSSDVEVVPQPPSLELLEEANSDYSDDDLPEPGELLRGLSGSRRKGAGSESSSAKYCNSELDALIRSVDVDERTRVELPSSPAKDHSTSSWLRDALGDDVDIDFYSATDNPADYSSNPAPHGLKRKVGSNFPASQRKKLKPGLNSGDPAHKGSPSIRKEKVHSHVQRIHLLTEHSHTNVAQRVHASAVVS